MGRILTGHDASGGRCVYSKGTCGPDGCWPRRYNIDGPDEVYISRNAPKALSNDDDIVLVRATDGNYVMQPGAISEIPEEADDAPEDALSLFPNVLSVRYRAEYRGVSGTEEEGREALERPRPSRRVP